MAYFKAQPTQLYRQSLLNQLDDLLKSYSPDEVRTLLFESVLTTPENHEKYRLSSYMATEVIRSMFTTTPLGVIPPAYPKSSGVVSADTSTPSYDISDMTKAELESFAEANDLDVSIYQTKAEMVEEIHEGMAAK